MDHDGATILISHFPCDRPGRASSVLRRKARKAPFRMAQYFGIAVSPFIAMSAAARRRLRSARQLPGVVFERLVARTARLETEESPMIGTIAASSCVTKRTFHLTKSTWAIPPR